MRPFSFFSNCKTNKVKITDDDLRDMALNIRIQRKIIDELNERLTSLEYKKHDTHEAEAHQYGQSQMG